MSQAHASASIASPDVRRWLLANRTERMDALDVTGIFPPERQAFHRARYRFALSYAAGMRVADIACGLGYGCRILKQGGAESVIGIDASQEAVDYGRSVHRPAGVDLTCADATRTGLPESSLEIITSFETIEHVADTAALLGEFERLLKPGGTLIVSSPNDWGLTEYHCHTWTPFEFMAEVAAYFHIVSAWEQYSAKTAKNYPPYGIKPWSEETETRAECLILVAQKKDGF